MSQSFTRLMAEVRACRVCEAVLPLGPRPVVRGLPGARLLIIGQAPGTRVHETGISFNDRSGDRLRDWLGVGRETFYDESLIAIMPMGFCYPGRLPNGGDAPPRPECAPLWHDRVRTQFGAVRLTLLVGSYALAADDKRREKPRRSMTDAVAAWRDGPSDVLPLPHPSWRTMRWEAKNPWFTAELLPELRRRVAMVLA